MFEALERFVWRLRCIIVNFWQRRTRGFDDSQLWDLDGTFAEWIVPRLKRFKKKTYAHPGDLTEGEWDDLLDKMIEGFEFRLSDEYWKTMEGPGHDKLKEALRIFSERFDCLWW